MRGPVAPSSPVFSSFHHPALLLENGTMDAPTTGITPPISHNAEEDCKMPGASDTIEEEDHPIFMDGLPSDFSEHPALAALASLLEEDEKDDGDEKPSSDRGGGKKQEPAHNVCYTTVAATGGGKTRRVKSRNAARHAAAPYPMTGGPHRAGGGRAGKDGGGKKAATVAEASLFLKMWKL